MKYRTARYLFGDRKLIDEIEIERETDTSVWVNGRRHLKTSDMFQYWDTWDEAFEYLRDKAHQKISGIRNELTRAQDELAAILNLQKPGSHTYDGG